MKMSEATPVMQLDNDYPVRADLKIAGFDVTCYVAPRISGV